MKGLLLLAALATYQTPAGYDAVESETGADAAVTLTKGFHKIEIRLFGAGGSRFKTPKGFVAGRAGAKAVGDGYERPYPLLRGDPHSPAGGGQSVETFRIVRGPGKEFFVLSSVWESAVPDLSGESEKAWQAFVQGFELKKEPSRGSPRRGR